MVPLKVATHNREGGRGGLTCDIRLYPAARRFKMAVHWWDLALIVAAAVSLGYVLLNGNELQFRACMGAVQIPVGVYNNPTRVAVHIEIETLIALANELPNFIVDKEAMPNVAQLVQVKRRLGDRLNILCCDYPKYSIVLPTLAVGGNGTANIGGNIIPEEMARLSRPWISFEQVEESRKLYLQWYPLLEALYWFSNPIVPRRVDESTRWPVDFTGKGFTVYSRGVWRRSRTSARMGRRSRPPGSRKTTSVGTNRARVQR
jgi:hypothetical protein